MDIDNFGQIILDEADLIDFYYKNAEGRFSFAYVSFDPIASSLDIERPNLIKYEPKSISIEKFDNLQQTNWFMPEQYKTLDIAKWVLNQCSNEAELQRAGQELLLYQEKDLFDFLRYMKYLVDLMREKNIVWGVGRGSSVASFVLFLIGIHKINSLFYQLDIKEFLR